MGALLQDYSNSKAENRRYKTVEDKMIYIPLLETLQSLLENDAVMSEVRLYPMLHSKVSVNVHCVLRGCC